MTEAATTQTATFVALIDMEDDTFAYRVQATDADQAYGIVAEAFADESYDDITIYTLAELPAGALDGIEAI